MFKKHMGIPRPPHPHGFFKMQHFGEVGEWKTRLGIFPIRKGRIHPNIMTMNVGKSNGTADVFTISPPPKRNVLVRRLVASE
jgi:hypothetical protein